MKPLIPRTSEARRKGEPRTPNRVRRGLTGDRGCPARKRHRRVDVRGAQGAFERHLCRLEVGSDRVGKASRWRVGKSDVHTMPVVYWTKRDKTREREKSGRRRQWRERRKERRKERERERTEPPRKSCGGVPADGPGPTRSIYPFFESAFSLRLSIFLFLDPSLAHSPSLFHPFHLISRSRSRTLPHPRDEREGERERNSLSTCLSACLCLSVSPRERRATWQH